ncbi:MAG: hypothetical protein WBK97_06665 [Bacteroidales bacterium]
MNAPFYGTFLPSWQERRPAVVARKILPTYGGSPPYSGANVFLSRYSPFTVTVSRLSSGSR